MTMQSTGSPVMAFMNTRTPGAFSAGASVSSRMCSASSIRPSPIETRPISLMRERGAAAEGDEADDEQDRRDGGDIERQDLHDQRGADIGAEHDGERRHQADQAFGREGTGDQRGRGAALQQRGEAEAGRKRGEAVAQAFGQQRRRSGPKARRIPLWTMCRPHSSNATPPIRSRRTIVPMLVCFRRIELKVQAIAKRRRINPLICRKLPWYQRDTCAVWLVRPAGLGKQNSKTTVTMRAVPLGEFQQFFCKT